MIRTVEALVDERGNVPLVEPVQLVSSHRAIVVILDELAGQGIHESALLNEQALADDWNRPEEDAAWSHLQPAR